MDRSTEDLVKIAEAGGGFILDAEGKSIDELMKIVVAAAEGEAMLTIRNMGEKTTEELVSLAAAGDGMVTFAL